MGKAQPPDITGTWTMCEMTHKTPEGNQVMSEEEIKAGNYETDFYFMNDGVFKQTSNMSGSGTKDTYEGTWKLVGDDLILNLYIKEQMMDVIWDFEMKDDRMNLSRTSPDGTQTIVNTFKKKA
jgi:hypothetical protein